MVWKKIISFKDDKGEERGHINAATSDGKVRLQVIGRIWSWSAEEGSILRQTIEEAINQGINDCQLYISSPGGSTFAGTEIVNLLSRFKDVKIEVGALMCSAATYITSHFHTTIKKNTQGMIHKPSGIFEGNEDQVEGDLKLLKNTTQDYLNTYAAKTKKTVAEIAKLWEKGDYWMNAQELKDNGFVDAIQGEIAAVSDIDYKELTALNAPTIPEPTKNPINKNKMDREKLIALYGLDANATDEQIMEAARAAKVAQETLAENQRKQKELEATTSKEKANALVDQAIKDKKILADQKETFVQLAEANYENTEKVLNSMSETPAISGGLKPKAQNPDGSQKETDPKRAEWTLEDYLTNDPAAFEKMKLENPDKAAELENAYFNA